jgi:hypothetical protein
MGDNNGTNQLDQLESGAEYGGSGLNPTLQAVLNNLDVDLNEELTRYRREKRKQGVSETPATAAEPVELGRTPTPPAANGADTAELPEVGAVNPFAETNGDRTPAQDLEASETKGTEAGSSAATPSEPKDYLESSQQLVQTLEEEERRKRASLAARRSRRSRDSLLSPLGIGSILLFLVAIGSLGYAVYNFSANQQARQSDETREDRVGQLLDSTADSGPSEAIEAQPSEVTPDLASREFVDLDLQRLGTLESESEAAPSPVATPTATPSPTPAAATSPPRESAGNGSEGLGDLSSTLIPPAAESPSPGSGNGSSTATPTPVATASPTPAPSSTVSAASFPDFYYVLMEYKNDESLFKAREVVPDAYVREFPIGVRIQVAAFEDEASAKVMVEQMKEQGLAAQMYTP